MSAGRLRLERGGLAVAGWGLLGFLALPVVALFLATSPSALRDGLSHPLVGPALRLSLLTTSLSLAIVVGLGTPLAWWLANASGRAARALETLVQLPAVIPPAVAGVALLLTFGRRGLLAGWAYPTGSSLAFSTTAVVLAEVFVSAPYFVQAATSGFRRIDPKLLLVARTFGAAPLRVFSRVAVPLAAPGLLAGGAMSWARSLGEFGATLMFAGNLEGRTQTLPLAIYTAFESDSRVAQALSIVLVAVAYTLLLLVRWLLARTAAGGEAA
ncbi:MAG: molybdate ABC transporter permease subunit [Polyangiaceae bacterium]|nr:molybdate ABC transporter permease subunit [Polyangiaceae bacterium]